MVPDHLRKNWTLIIGDSAKELPTLLNSLKRIDLFFHDSLHTYNHMTFEFDTVFPYLNKTKYIFSDDINANTAFDEFVSKNNLQLKKFYGFGIAKA